MSEALQDDRTQQAGSSNSTADAPPPQPAVPQEPQTAQDSMYAFAQAVFSVRKRDCDPPMQSSVLLEPRPASASPYPARSSGSVTSSDLRSLAASRKMVHFIAALSSDEYEDVQLLVERAYELYRAEYELAWRALVREDPSESSQQQAGSPVSEDDALLLHGFLTTVLDWVPLPQLRSGHLIDDDEDEERSVSDPQYEAQQRRVSDQLKAAADPPAAQSTEEKSGPSSDSQGQRIQSKVELLQGRARAFQKLLDLVHDDEGEVAEDFTERLNAVVQISGQPFLLTLDASLDLRSQTKYLHILAKRCVFLLETSYRLRLIVQYAKSEVSVRDVIDQRVRSAISVWVRMRHTVEPGPPSDSPWDLLDGAIFAFRPRPSPHDRAAQKAKDTKEDGNRDAYELGVLRFHDMLKQRINNTSLVETLTAEFALEAQGAGLTVPPRPRISPQMAARLDRIAPPGNGPANVNFWQMAHRAFPNAAAAGAGAGAGAGRNGEVLVDARQIFQRRRREAFSLRSFVLSFVPNSVQTAVYNAVVPAPIRLVIAHQEARALLPQLLMHSTWLVVKIGLLISVLAARLGIPVPNGQPYPQQRAAGQGAAAGNQQQGQAQANTVELLGKLSTLLGWLALADEAFAIVGFPPLSVFWKLYGVILGVVFFIVWDMERWLNRRLESIWREQRRNQRLVNVAGRAIVPLPARNAAGGGRAENQAAAAAAGQGGVAGGEDAQVPQEGADGVPSGEATTTTATDAAGQPPPPPSYPSPVYAPRRISVFARQRRDPGQRLGLVVAASLGPAPLLTYLLERLAYIGLEHEDEELGLIPRSRLPNGAILDDNTGLIRAIYRGDRRERSVRAAQRLCAPPRQVRTLYADIESESPTAVHRTGRAPLSTIAQMMATDGHTRTQIISELLFETVYRLIMTLALMIITLVPECEILRRKAIDRRTEIWRNARRREIERRVKVEEYERERGEREEKDKGRLPPSSSE